MYMIHNSNVPVETCNVIIIIITCRHAGYHWQKANAGILQLYHKIMQKCININTVRAIMQFPSFRLVNRTGWVNLQFEVVNIRSSDHKLI